MPPFLSWSGDTCPPSWKHGKNAAFWDEESQTTKERPVPPYWNWDRNLLWSQEALIVSGSSFCGSRSNPCLRQHFAAQKETLRFVSFKTRTLTPYWSGGMLFELLTVVQRSKFLPVRLVLSSDMDLVWEHLTQSSRPRSGVSASAEI